MKFIPNISIGKDPPPIEFGKNQFVDLRSMYPKHFQENSQLETARKMEIWPVRHIHRVSPESMCPNGSDYVKILTDKNSGLQITEYMNGTSTSQVT